MSVQKNKGSDKAKRCSQRAKYSKLPGLTISKTVEQKIADNWAAYQRAEKDAEMEDINTMLLLLFAISIFLMGYFLSFTSQGFAFAIPACVSYYALKLRGGYSLTPRNEGDRR